MILESLPLRDLYSLTVASKFFYNNFISIYRNRVALERIPRPKRPEFAPCSWMPSLALIQSRLLISLTGITTLFLIFIMNVSFLEAIVAGILISASPDSSQRNCVIFILAACCYSCILAILCHADALRVRYIFPSSAEW